MSLAKIKRYDDSIWLHILKTKTVFDTDEIKAQKDWLIEQAEKTARYEQALREIADGTIPAGQDTIDVAKYVLNPKPKEETNHE